MTQATARPAQLAPVRIGKGARVHLGYLSSIKGPNGEPRYCSYCPASRGRDGTSVTAGEAIAAEVDCRSCLRQASPESRQRAAATARDLRAQQVEGDDITAPAITLIHPGQPCTPGEDRGAESLLDHACDALRARRDQGVEPVDPHDASVPRHLLVETLHPAPTPHLWRSCR